MQKGDRHGRGAPTKFQGVWGGGREEGWGSGSSLRAAEQEEPVEDLYPVLALAFMILHCLDCKGY